MDADPVRLRAPHADGDDHRLEAAAARAARLGTADVTTILACADELAGDVPLPGRGDTLRRWELLASLGAQDLTVARVLEPHLDALAILAEAGLRHLAEPGSTWGVYAAEAPGARVQALRDGDGGWTLTGTKPWCSLAGRVSHALVTAWVDDERRGLFAVDLRSPGVRVDADHWAPAGLARVTTATTTLDLVPAQPVGGPGWYLERAGFAWGGIGVAAIWHGAATGLLRRMVAAAEQREPDQVALMHLGAADADLAASAAVLRQAADDVDAAAPTAPALLAARTRQVVAEAVERVLVRTGHALGPGPLAHEPVHVRRVADLTLYLRQHHAERDAAALGRLVLDDQATQEAARPFAEAQR